MKIRVELAHKDQFHEVYLVKVTKNKEVELFCGFNSYIDDNKNSLWSTVSVISYEYKKDV